MRLGIFARTTRQMRHGLMCAPLWLAASGLTAQAAIVISTAPTANMTCAAGTCTPTARNANLNVTDLASMLASGDAKVATSSRARDIRFEAALSWTSASRLTLDAHRSIIFTQPISVSGPGAMTITTGAGTGADFSFYENAKIDFWDLSSSLVINGTTYQLVKNIRGLADKVARNPTGAFALANDHKAVGIFAAAPVSTTFSGIFEGLGHRIANLTIDQTTDGGDVGLFADTNGGILRDIRLTNAHITVTGSAGSVGALVGSSGSTHTPQAALTNDSVEAQVSGPNNAVVGGLAGRSSGSIINSDSAGSVTGGYISGGLVGSSFDPAIFYSHSSATVYSSAPNGGVGGLAGDQSGAVVFRCYATGSVTGPVAGGLIGSSSTSRVQDSFATGAATGADNEVAGGLIGIYNSGFSSPFIVNTYAMGSVSAGTNGKVGGLIGLSARGTVSASYSTGPVSVGQSGYAGGFVGSAGSVAFQSDYWDTETSGQTQGTDVGNVSGLTGMTTAQLKAGLPSGFDPAFWRERSKINNGFPYLHVNPPPQ